MNASNVTLETNMNQVIGMGGYFGDPLPDSNTVPEWTMPNYWQPIIQEYYPHYCTHWYSTPNSMEQAFKVVEKLIEKKLIKLTTVKSFIETVNEISKVL